MNEEETVFTEPLFYVKTKKERIQRSENARAKRKAIKEIKEIHGFKEQKENRKRLIAKKRLEKQKKKNKGLTL